MDRFRRILIMYVQREKSLFRIGKTVLSPQLFRAGDVTAAVDIDENGLFRRLVRIVKITDCVRRTRQIVYILLLNQPTLFIRGKDGCQLLERIGIRSGNLALGFEQKVSDNSPHFNYSIILIAFLQYFPPKKITEKIKFVVKIT